ncbi:uncharacterized protein LOC123209552 [Mangifera indica]|uniref:uncharacterized protein LOC123209552 n=1 Tax=Mangifera indica TaxID=29780 RepID=UPI001CF9C170|nr:uncharacterized protein LOC123209552 [Mangifera indica]
MKASETSIKSSGNSVQSQGQASKIQNEKPHFKPAQDDTKPPFQDPILRSDPIETEEAVLKLPPFSIKRL